MPVTAAPRPHANVSPTSFPATRWLLIPAGVAVLLCLGTVYAWSIFVKPVAARYNESTTDALLPFTVLLAVFAATMPFAGRLIELWGPRWTALVGVLLTGGGYVASAFAPNIATLVLTYGVVAGVGVGVAYGVPLAVTARHFPDRKGLAVGLTVVGFGLSPLITAPLARHLIALHGVGGALWMLGAGLTVVMLVLVPFLKMPAAASAGLRVAQDAASALPSGPAALLRSGRFWALWVCYVSGTLVGLGAIGIASPVATELVKLDPSVAAWAVSLFAVFNGLGRPLFGSVADRFGTTAAAVSAYALTAAASGGMLTAGPGSTATYLACFCVLWMCLGGWLAIAPTSTLKLFDPARYASHYGLLFTAYGVGALAGTLLAGRIRDLTGSFDGAFTAFLLALAPGALAAAWLGWSLRKRER
jgi:MFS family permease